MRLSRLVQTIETPFEVNLKNFKRFSELANRETDYFEEVSGGGPEILLEPDPCNKALICFLSSIPIEDLYAILALMYSGRDNEENPLTILSDVIPGCKDPDIAACTIAEKVPRVSYIEKFLESHESFDLAGFLSEVGQLLKERAL